MNVTPEQAALLEAVLRFANVQRIRSTRQVEDLFRRVPLVRVLQRLQPGEEAAYARDQARLKAWLEAIANRHGAVVARDVSAQLSTIPMALQFDPQRLRLRAVYALTGVEAICAFGAILLLLPSTGLATRLGHCAAPGCGKFNLDLAVRPGRPWRFCSTPHRLAAADAQAAERMRRKRAIERLPNRSSQPRRPRR
jgi:hypothetical protein